MDLVWKGGVVILNETQDQVSESGGTRTMIQVRDLVRSSPGVVGALVLNGVDVLTSRSRSRPVCCAGYLSASQRSGH
jgi:hypothetical protein